eukprot:1929497-Prymnesium_polylepis.1
MAPAAARCSTAVWCASISRGASLSGGGRSLCGGGRWRPRRVGLAAPGSAGAREPDEDAVRKLLIL